MTVKDTIEFKLIDKLNKSLERHQLHIDVFPDDLSKMPVELMYKNKINLYAWTSLRDLLHSERNIFIISKSVFRIFQPGSEASRGFKNFIQAMRQLNWLDECKSAEEMLMKLEIAEQ